MPPDPKEDWLRLKTIVGEVLLAERDERAAIIEELTCGDDALALQVKEWLAVESSADEFLERPAPGASWERGQRTPLEPGSIVAGYRVTGLLGSGGSGLVYSARQENPAREVALKVFLGGLGTESGRARFAHEAEVLASLRHPGIAQIFEGGVHLEGGVPLPFFAMELVTGARTVTDYTRSESRTSDQRVELLVRVCEAVAHGHRRGVIHRDLKPENVLVDELGAPRVIDFGLAKLTANSPASLRTTLPGSFLGTLGYMSPEHAAGDPGAIDVRSDVYALGVLAFEVLFETSPHALAGRTLTEALTIIRDVPPRRPSEHGAPRDLESILLKALEKDPARRYAGAGELGADLERFLRREPVHARGPSFAYHARHFLRRRRIAVAGAVGSAILLVAAGVGSSMQTAGVEKRERARAEQVKDFLLSVLELTGPGVSGRHDMTVGELLDRAAPRIDDELAGVAEAALEVHASVGKAYRELGLYDEAEFHLRRAVELGRESGSAMVLGSVLSALSDVLLEVGKAQDAEHVLTESIAVFEAEAGLSPIFVTIATKKLAEARRQLGDVEGAEDLARSALSAYKLMLGGAHEAVARTRETLARIHIDADRSEQAVDEARLALDIDLANHGEQSLAVARVRLVLADALELGGEEAAAAEERARASILLQRIVPEGHPLRAPSR
ncbi:MAG: tetratricopeptide (TPR) repeat protein/predicted Ser/Thr protein kinase [Planctomycetota bacterium]